MFPSEPRKMTEAGLNSLPQLFPHWNDASMRETQQTTCCHWNHRLKQPLLSLDQTDCSHETPVNVGGTKIPFNQFQRLTSQSAMATWMLLEALKTWRFCGCSAFGMSSANVSQHLSMDRRASFARRCGGV